MTAVEPQNEPVLKRFRAAVAEVYGDRLERVILYGSRARGDHQPIPTMILRYSSKTPEVSTMRAGGSPL